MRELILGAVLLSAFMGLYCCLFGEWGLAAICAGLGLVGVLLEKAWARVVVNG